MTNDKIEFSVAVPVGRVDDRLATALRSLVIQNVNLNIALLDASGSDRVRRIAEEFKSDLTLRLHRPDTGQAAAIRAGWRQTTGNILCWLNADDALLPGALAEVAAIFSAQPETDVVYGHSVIQDSTGRTTGYHMAVDHVSDALYQTNLISQPSCFVRRQAIEDVGGIDPKLKYVMDWELWMRLHHAGKKFYFTDKPLSAVVWETGTKTASVSPRRLFEIARLVVRYAGSKAAFRTIFGVLRHHLGTYTALARLYLKLQPKRIVTARKTIAGLERHGRIMEAAKVPLANLSEAPVSTINLHLEWADGGLDGIEIDGVSTPIEKRDRNTLPLPRPVQPGEMVWLTVRPVTGAILRFISAAWENPDDDVPLDDSPVVFLRNCDISVPATGSVKTLKQTLLARESNRPRARELLHGINLTARRGERIGIVGGNGAGKTTLLRLIAGIFPPDHGRRIVKGSVAAVLALGRGLDPELSLRANVALGLIQSNRNEIYSEQLVQKILDFATLSERANDPLRRLSAGLQARFAFSLSIHQSPDILILDEIFTIGDAGFVEKAIAAMMQRVDDAPILFIASHSEEEIREICSRALLLDNGEIVMDADPSSVFSEYRKMLSER